MSMSVPDAHNAIDIDGGDDFPMDSRQQKISLTRNVYILSPAFDIPNNDTPVDIGKNYLVVVMPVQGIAIFTFNFRIRFNSSPVSASQSAIVQSKQT